MTNLINALCLVCIFLIASSCAPFVDSPFSDKLLRPDRDMNQVAIRSLGDVESDGVIRIAVFADPHQNYKDLDQVLFDINQEKGLDFVAGLGDYTNSGYNLEYDQFISALDSVKTPRVMAIGNHDSVGAGPELFFKAFGTPNFYFESTNYRFIFFNGNNWENPEDFNPSWLKSAVDGTSKKVIIFSHVQLLDTERYKDDVLTTMQGIVNDSKVKLALNGHNHIYNLVVSNNTYLLQVGRTQGRHWVLLELQGNDVCMKRMDTMEQDCRTLK
jgi:predicted phosphodiesterase